MFQITKTNYHQHRKCNLLDITESMSGPTVRFHPPCHPCFVVPSGAMMSLSVALIGAVLYRAGAVPTAPRGIQAAEALRRAGVV